MRVLVTGANGFIGSSLIKYIQTTTDWNITAMIRKHSNNLDENVRKITHDLSDTNVSDECYDVIFHCAVSISYSDIDQCINNNIISTKNILEFANNNHCKLFIYMSSVSVYGDSGTFRESDLPLPNNIYGISKLSGEYLCRMYRETMKVLILRINNVWGPNPDKNRFQYFIEEKFKTEKCPHFEIFSKNGKNWIHIDELCIKIIKLVKYFSSLNKNVLEIFNISGEDNITILDFIKKFGNEFTYEYKNTEDIRNKLDINLDDSKFKEIFS